ncbi:MAG: hypothetical protein MNPFHGCM_00444 [Gemmatimonadaceae bacterium]|nr:hypothetical protein [Gemmatimonadaceae bacterium]
MPNVHRSRTIICAWLAVAMAGAATAQQPAGRRWYKGNTHTHTLNSDGDSPPSVVTQWYREHGYQFVVITDHEFITDVTPLNALYGAAGMFLVIPGQEVTDRVPDSSHPEGRRAAHMNALGTRTVIRPAGGTTIAETYARNLPRIRAAGGVPQVNHPNWRWSVSLDDMLALPDSTIFEVWNGHPGINNLGGADGAGRSSPSTDALWDSLLTRGKLLFGAATDDVHTFARPWDRREPRPGQAWVVVRADTLTPEAILEGLRRGDFYASTGISIKDYQADDTGIVIALQRTGYASDDTRFHTEFVGKGGRVLAAVDGLEARYRFRGDEGYVRARITDSYGSRAWTQPVILPRRR